MERSTGKKYPLLLEDIKTLTECKESNSDFYVDPPQHDTQFQLWTNAAFDLDCLDHTWIKTIDPAGYFCCAGGHGVTKKLDHNTATFSENTSLYPVFKVQDITYTLTVGLQTEQKAVLRLQQIRLKVNNLWVGRMQMAIS